MVHRPPFASISKLHGASFRLTTHNRDGAYSKRRRISPAGVQAHGPASATLNVELDVDVPGGEVGDRNLLNPADTQVGHCFYHVIRGRKFGFVYPVVQAQIRRQRENADQVRPFPSEPFCKTAAGVVHVGIRPHVGVQGHDEAIPFDGD